MGEISSVRLQHGKRNADMGHRKYLPRHYPYRRQKKAFNGKQEHGNPPHPLLGEAICMKLNDMNFSWGKMSSKRLNNQIGDDYWKRIFEFFKLPY